MTTGEEQEGKKEISFIVTMFRQVLKILIKVSLLNFFLRILRKKNTYRNMEICVLAFFVLWIGLLGIFSCFETRWWMYLILVLPGIRIFEIVIYQFNILFGPPFWSRVKSYRRNIALLFLNYVEILFCFALFYYFLSSSFEGGSHFSSVKSFWASTYFSLVTMSTLGYGDVTPTDALGTSLVCIQVSVGIFMGVWIFSRIISFLPKPKTDDPEEKSRQWKQRKTNKKDRKD